MKQTFDYTPTKEEEEDAIELEKLDAACLVLGVEEINVANGGRLNFKGRIDRAACRSRGYANGGGRAPADAARPLIKAPVSMYGRLQIIWADGGYLGALVNWVKQLRPFGTL